MPESFNHETNSMSQPETILDFSRFEFKYVLQKSLREAVESELQYFMELDPFVRKSEAQRYQVRSLYFDDPEKTAFYDKIDGLRDRSKFRIRTYCRSPDNITPVFLEQKGRINNRVLKHRVPLGISDTMPTDFSRLELASDDPVYSTFVYDSVRKLIEPIALVDYFRRPYISRYDHKFRVTFDEQLSAIETTKLFPGKIATTKKLLVGYTVMEVKFDRTLPAWFHRIIQSYELSRQPLSKICESMITLGMAVDL